MTDLKAIQEREEKATTGPWESDEDVETHAMVIFQSCNGGLIVYDGECLSEADADFIAHAREDIPMLLKALAEARGLLLAYVRDSLEWNGSCIEEPRVCTRCHNYRDEMPPHQPHCLVPAFEDAVLADIPAAGAKLELAEKLAKALGHAIHLTEHNKANCARCREARKRINTALREWEGK